MVEGNITKTSTTLQFSRMPNTSLNQIFTILFCQRFILKLLAWLWDVVRHPVCSYGHGQEALWLASVNAGLRNYLIIWLQKLFIDAKGYALLVLAYCSSAVQKGFQNRYSRKAMLRGTLHLDSCLLSSLRAVKSPRGIFTAIYLRLALEYVSNVLDVRADLGGKLVCRFSFLCLLSAWAIFLRPQRQVRSSISWSKRASIELSVL